MASAKVKTENSSNIDAEILYANPNERIFDNLKSSLEIDPNSYPVIYGNDVNNETCDEIDFSLAILDKLGYQSKVFSYAEMQDDKSDFIVKSDNCLWHVFHVNTTNYKIIPRNLLMPLIIFEQKNIKINGIAIAKPIPKENVSDVIEQEIVKEINVISNVAKTAFLLGAFAFKKSFTNTKISQTVTSPVKLQELPDPVLLVKIQNCWVEIGRW